MSRVQRAYRQLPTTEVAEPLIIPSNIEDLWTKSQEIAVYTEWARSISSTDICAYSDGSSEGHGRST